MSTKRGVVVCALVAVWSAGCTLQPPSKDAAAQKPAIPIGVPVAIKIPLGLPPVPIPADNPPTAETIALGRKLYYDPALSIDRSVSCASCHDPKLGFTDCQPNSAGVKGQRGNRSAPSVINSAYYTTQFWDGRALSLEKQAEGPVQNPIEMGHDLTGVERRLMSDPAYRADFEKAFGPGPVTYEMVAKSIATFERTVLSGGSPFDRYMYGGDRKAMTASQIRGLEVFRNSKKANCAVCHTIGEKDSLFTDNKFHNVGVGVSDEKARDVGRYQVTKIETDRGAFKTPTLRNITQTAPYMHDGSEKTLEDVRDFYIGAGNSNPYLDKEIKVLDYLTGQERADLLAFLEALKGELPNEVGPVEQKAAQSKPLGLADRILMR